MQGTVRLRVHCVLAPSRRVSTLILDVSSEHDSGRALTCRAHGAAAAGTARLTTDLVIWRPRSPPRCCLSCDAVIARQRWMRATWAVPAQTARCTLVCCAYVCCTHARTSAAQALEQRRAGAAAQVMVLPAAVIAAAALDFAVSLCLLAFLPLAMTGNSHSRRCGRRLPRARAATIERAIVDAALLLPAHAGAADSGAQVSARLRRALVACHCISLVCEVLLLCASLLAALHESTSSRPTVRWLADGCPAASPPNRPTSRVPRMPLDCALPRRAAGLGVQLSAATSACACANIQGIVNLQVDSQLFLAFSAFCTVVSALANTVRCCIFYECTLSSHTSGGAASSVGLKAAGTSLRLPAQQRAGAAQVGLRRAGRGISTAVVRAVRGMSGTAPRPSPSEHTSPSRVQSKRHEQCLTPKQTGAAESGAAEGHSINGVSSMH